MKTKYIAWSVSVCLGLAGWVWAASTSPQPTASPRKRTHSTTMTQRKAAAARAAAARKDAAANPDRKRAPLVPPPGPGGVPDYFGSTPNYANSPLPQVVAGSVVPGTGIRKFVDTLAGLGPDGANNLGQYIDVASADTTTYPGSDYYEIGVTQYAQKLHTDLPPTTFRGYRDLRAAAPANHYLGPLILAQKNRPVRVKFVNLLPSGAAGDHIVPVDTTLMGAGAGPGDVGTYTQNRATLHLHGGLQPWISDGTPHQWTAPVDEVTPYEKGVASQNVPDMPAAGKGEMTFYWPNVQSSRLMMYHDHALGLTRLNAYAGEAGAYLLVDPTEQSLIANGVLPNPLGGLYTYGIPLVIQDKTFVPEPAQLAQQDPTWDPAKWGGKGNLWFPHVYMPNQNPGDLTGTNAMGRWDYGPWFWPPFTGVTHGPLPNEYAGNPGEPPLRPGVPNVSTVPEAFMDTPLVNGVAYPFVSLPQGTYRFRVLSVGNDRMLNLSLFYADTTLPAESAGWGKEVRMVPAAPRTGNPGELPPCDADAAVDAGTGLPSGCWPRTWPTDSREGGVPDPRDAGPQLVQIGTEGGFLPAPVTVPAQPINYVYNRRDITVLNLAEHGLLLGPAERADVIVDFSRIPESRFHDGVAYVLLYNDAPAPVPAADPRYDYYTGDPDNTATGGAPTTLPGYGPNTRTIMLFKITRNESATPFDVAPLRAAFATSGAVPGAYAVSQDPVLVPEPPYGTAYDTTFTGAYAQIGDTSFTFTPYSAGGPATPLTLPLEPKSIIEDFDPDYGRMNAMLGVEVPKTDAQTQTSIMYHYIDPTTEFIDDSVAVGVPNGHDGTQLWKITHNGVDTHAIHFHLFDVQIVNRVGWDGALRPPDANELGWKETVRMNPLEDIIVALRPVAPPLPFGVPNSQRLLDPTMPQGSMMGFSTTAPDNTPRTVSNETTNFLWEYVWHCHLLGHEEFDMMRPIAFHVSSTVPDAPFGLVLSTAGVPVPSSVTVRWSDTTPVSAPATLGNPKNEIGFRVERSVDGSPWAPVGTALANATAFTDGSILPGRTYGYRVVAFNAAGEATSPPAPVTVPASSVAIFRLPAGVPAQPGTDIVVPVTVDEAAGAFAFDLDVAYDPALLTPVTVYQGAFGSLFAMNSNLGIAGHVRIGFYSDTPRSGSGELAWVVFHVAPAAGNTVTPLHWANAEINEGGIASASVDGSVAIERRSVVLSIPQDVAGAPTGPASVVRVPILANEAAGFSSIDVVVRTNTLVATPTAAFATLPGWSVTLSDATVPGTLHFVTSGPAVSGNDVAVAEFELHVAPAAAIGDKTPIDLVSALVNGGAIVPSLVDGLLTLCVDQDQDGWTICGAHPDCNDADPAVNPGHAEVYCNTVDDDCNPATVDAPDADHDTFDVCGDGTAAGHVNPDGKPADCNDANPAVFPGALELCNGLDDNCNALVDENVDPLPGGTNAAGLNSCNDGNQCTTDLCGTELGQGPVCVHGTTAACTASGFVHYYRNAGAELSTKPVPGVGIDVVGAGNTPDTITAADGTFTLAPLSGTVTVTTLHKLETAPCTLGAVSSLDATAIARHAVGLDTLTNLQQMAADTSGNNRITSFDASLAAQLSVCSIERLPVASQVGSDWQFLRCTGDVASGCAAWPPLPGDPSYTFAPITAPQGGLGFYAVLFGDVTGNWAPPAFAAAPAEAPAAAGPKVTPLTTPRALPATLYIAQQPTRRADGSYVMVLGIRDADGIQALDLTAAFGAGTVTAVTARATGLASNYSLVTRAASDALHVALYGVQPLAGHGAFLELQFRPAGPVNAPPFTFQVEANEGLVPVRW